MPSGCLVADPAKITSSGLRARTALADCSPSTHSTASLMLDLPEPFGPTMTTMPGWSSAEVRAAKDLKPTRSRRRRCKGAYEYARLSPSADETLNLLGLVEFVLRLFVTLFDVEHLQRGVGGGLLGSALRVAAAAGVDVGPSLHLDDEHRGVAWPSMVHQVVDGRRLEARLRHLLEARFGVDDPLRTEPNIDVVIDKRQQHGPRRVQAGVQIDCADHGLEASRQQRRSVATPAAGFAAA